MPRLSVLAAALALILSAAFSAPAASSSAGSYADGLAAYQRFDFSAARSAWHLSAALGDAPSAMALAVLLENGMGTAPDMAAAEAWYKYAAALGYAPAIELVNRRGYAMNAAPRPSMKPVTAASANTQPTTETTAPETQNQPGGFMFNSPTDAKDVGAPINLSRAVRIFPQE